MKGNKPVELSSVNAEQVGAFSKMSIGTISGSFSVQVPGVKTSYYSIIFSGCAIIWHQDGPISISTFFNMVCNSQAKFLSVYGYCQTSVGASASNPWHILRISNTSSSGLLVRAVEPPMSTAKASPFTFEIPSSSLNGSTFSETGYAWEKLL